MKMSIYDNYHRGIQFFENENGEYDIPDELAYQWLEAEDKYHDAQDEARNFLSIKS